MLYKLYWICSCFYGYKRYIKSSSLVFYFLNYWRFCPIHGKFELFLTFDWLAYYCDHTKALLNIFSDEINCDFRTIRTNNTRVTSPNFPSNYANNLSCWISVQPPHSLSRVSLTFTHFELQSSPNCTADSVQVRFWTFISRQRTNEKN